MSPDALADEASVLRWQVPSYLHVRGLCLGLLATGPLLGLTLLTGDPRWLRGGLLGLSLILGWTESALTPAGAFVQACTITAVFVALVASRDTPWLFALICAAAAAGTVRLAGVGKRLRTLASFSFIPAIYLGFDISGHPSTLRSHEMLATLPSLALSLAIVLTMMAAVPRQEPTKGPLPRFFALDGWGEPRPYGGGMVAAALSVGSVATATLLLPITSGQWAVWSALSIVMADAGSGGRKLWERAKGASLGVPIGLVLALLVPRSSILPPTALLVGMLTLVAVRSYFAGIALRWGFIAFAVVSAGGSPFAGLERVVDVIAGGGFGLFGVLLGKRLVQYHTTWFRTDRFWPG